MSILHELEKSVKSDAPSYMEFLYRYNPKKKQVFAFYEGDEDSSYYHHILKKVIDDDCELEEIVAGCKNNVLKLQCEFDWSIYNKKQIVFFVDRDLSYWLGDSTEYAENVFVTDDYSVENYVATPHGFRAWLVHFEGFARAKKQEIDFMVSEFESSLPIFEREMMPIMAQAVVAKRHDSSISLGDFKLSINNTLKFETNNNHLAFKINTNDKILEKWKLIYVDQNEITMQLNKFEIKNGQYSIRGKWLLCFMAEMGEYMRIHSNLYAPSLGNAGKTNPTCSVPTTQCLSALAPYCIEVIPSRLVEFLDNTYKKYLESRGD